MSAGKFIYKGDYRRFNYLPRYYNEAKEQLDARKEEIRREHGFLADNEYQSKVGKGMFSSGRAKDKQKMSSILTARFFYIIVLLCLPITWIIYGELALWIGGLILCLPLFIKFKKGTYSKN
jgi:fatty acid desaturase